MYRQYINLICNVNLITEHKQLMSKLEDNKQLIDNKKSEEMIIVN